MAEEVKSCKQLGQIINTDDMTFKIANILVSSLCLLVDTDDMTFKIAKLKVTMDHPWK